MAEFNHLVLWMQRMVHDLVGQDRSVRIFEQLPITDRQRNDSNGWDESSRPLSIPFKFSTLQQQLFGVFDQLLDPGQELHCFPSIYDSMIIAHRHIHHGSNYDLTFQGNRTILDSV